MPIGRRRLGVAAATSTLLAGLIATPAAAGSLRAGDAAVESGSAVAVRPCLNADQPVQPIEAHRGWYELYYSAEGGCTVLRNTSDMAQVIWGDDPLVDATIDPPSRPLNSRKGVVDATVAQAAIDAEVTHPGGVVILPGEEVRLFGSTGYRLVLSDVKANKAVKVAAQLTTLYAGRGLWNLLARASFRDVISACAVAADSTWQNVERVKGIESLQDVLAQMGELSTCKQVYDAVTPARTPRAEPSYRAWLRTAAPYGQAFWTQAQDDISRLARSIILVLR